MFLATSMVQKRFSENNGLRESIFDPDSLY
jgi:hypothetical protein